MFVGDLAGAAAEPDPGIRNDDVEPAEPVQRGLDDLRDVCGIGGVADHGDRARLACDLLDRLRAAPRHNQGRSLLGESIRDRCTDPRPAPRDDGHPVLDLHATSSGCGIVCLIRRAEKN